MIAALFWKTLSPLLQLRKCQQRLERYIGEAQNLIGIGGAEDVTNSGEECLVKILKGMIENRHGKTLTILDVGANNGQFLELILNGIPGDQISIHCFEPSLATFASLQEKHGSHFNVTLNNHGLGVRSGQTKLYSDAHGSGLASLTRRNLDHHGIEFNLTENVQMDTVDSYCHKNGLGSVDLLKIDVEGHELDVLRGAEGNLRGGNVRMLTFEFGGCNIDTRTYLRDFWDFFSSMGVKSFYRIMPSGALFPIDSYHEKLEQFLTTNYLVVLDSAVAVN